MSESMLSKVCQVFGLHSNRQLTPLVVIDMQPSFKGAGLAHSNVAELCKITEQSNNPIYLVEYEGKGNTYRSISRYSSVQPIIKSTDDGSFQIIRRLVADGILSRQVRLCGVNYGACVARTANGLIRNGYDVTIVKWACANDPGWSTYSKGDSQFWDAFYGAGEISSKRVDRYLKFEDGGCEDSGHALRNIF